MLNLALAMLFFVGIHFLISGTGLRDRLVAYRGEQAFRAAFSVLSLLALGWVVFAYRQAPYVETWGQLTGFKPIAAVLMLVSFIFVVAGLTTPNPSAVSGESVLNDAEAARGILRITRHPFLWGLSLWALVHVIANGDVAALLLFGSLLALCLAGTRSIDAKRRRTYGDRWERFAAATSNVPFMAIKEGRNRLELGEIGWQRLGIAVALYLAMLHFHAKIFGVSPLF
ncbi:NnrU family protein [Methylococcus capsulatus]|nr:NnrU family protein [Methylococcus capsulatus]QXP89934.1 NnrU family protein [Methylococcus capsulatus]